VPRAYRTQINDVLLAALARTLGRWAGEARVLVDVEGHGREEVLEGIDLSRTVGWFTTLYPVLLDLRGREGSGEALKAVKEQLRAVPNRGIGHGALRWLSPRADVREALAALPQARVRFEYMGQLDGALGGEEGLFAMAPEHAGADTDARADRGHLLVLGGAVMGGRLGITWQYSAGVHRAETVEALARDYLAELRALIAHCTEEDAGGRTPSDFPLARATQDEVDRLVGSGREVEDLYRLSPMQEGMLFHTLLEPGSGVYVAQFEFELRGALDVDAFRRAWRDVVRRHAVLRTGFAWEEVREPLQVVRRRVEVPLVVEDWRDAPAPARAARLDAYLRDDRARGFDPAAPPLLRLALFRTGDDAHRLVLSLHMMVLDGWSVPLLFRDVAALYDAHVAGREPALPPARPYRAYIAWLGRQDLAAAERWWRRELAGFDAPTGLGLERPAVDTSAERYGRAERTLGPGATERLRAFARAHGLTVNTLAQGAWALLLARYSGDADVVFGVTVSGRPPEIAGVEEMVGLFINTLPVRVRVEEEIPVAAWLRALQARQAEMSDYEFSPLAQVQRWSEVPAGTSLFDTLFVFNNQPAAAAAGDGGDGGGGERALSIAGQPERDQTNYPLTLSVALLGDDLLFLADYAREHFGDGAVARLLDHYAGLLEWLAADGDRPLRAAELLSGEARERVLAEWGEAPLPPSDSLPIHARFERQAARAPGAVAVVADSREWSYAEVDARANRLAWRLIKAGVGPDERVGVCMRRSAAQLVAVLAVLKAGGAYVPLDPAYPRERLAFMLRDARVRLLLGDERAAALELDAEVPVLLPDADPSLGEESDASPAVHASPLDLAYVIYTSGSTGRPKGVAMTRGALMALLDWQRRGWPGGESAATLQFASLSFDVSFQEIFSTWEGGGRLVMVDEETRRDPERLLEWVERQGVTRLFLPFVALQNLAEAADALGRVPAGVREVVTAGEALQSTPALRRWFARVPGAVLQNEYGPSETHVVSAHRLGASPEAWPALPPIGRPIAGARLYVLDPGMRPVPPGVAGELYIGGAGLARGYL
ncbi:MAG TPA: condensation domain-containing protein, partial [Longimicrobium sp.]|nr:condensation domain-containing protein [Longimicrobium sp.]